MKFTPLTQTYSKHCTHCIVFLTDSEWLGISASAKIIEIWICVGFLEPQIVKNSWSTWWGPMSSSGDGGSVNLKSVAGVGLRRRILAKRESPVSNRVNLCIFAYARKEGVTDINILIQPCGSWHYVCRGFFSVTAMQWENALHHYITTFKRLLSRMFLNEDYILS